jgi:hypothetical protein
VGSIVETGSGKGVVTNVSLLKGMLKIRLDNGNESDHIECSVDEVRMVKIPSRRCRGDKAGGCSAEGCPSSATCKNRITDVDVDVDADTDPGGEIIIADESADILLDDELELSARSYNDL